MQIVNSTGATTITAAITTTGQTSISVANTQNLAAGVIIQIDTELLQVTAVSGLTLTVTRGFNSSAAATHLINVTVTILASVPLGTILNSTTAAAATSLAIAFNQIRVDGTVLSGGGSTACTTDAWGMAAIYISLTAGPHRIEVQATGAIPWTEPCLYVGALQTSADAVLQAFGLLDTIQISGDTRLNGNYKRVPASTWGALAYAYPIAWQGPATQILAFLGGYDWVVQDNYDSDAATVVADVYGQPGQPWGTATWTNDKGTLQGPLTLTPLVTPSITFPATDAGFNPLATDVVAALITAGVLQYVSGSSGPLQLTPTAVANVTVPAPINLTTQDTIEFEHPHTEPMPSHRQRRPPANRQQPTVME